MVTTNSLDSSLQKLEAVLRGYESVIVAFSGGADSAFLAFMAQKVLGDNALCVTAISPSFAQAEHEDCAQLVKEWGLQWEEVQTEEFENPAYVRNEGDRCFYCKTALMDAIEPITKTNKSVVVLGVNVDDLGDHRPGQLAASERGAKFPLVEAGFTKDMVRQASKQMGLRTWSKPAAACLSSRVPYGTSVTVGILSKVERAEAALHQLGFDQLRVRHYDTTARLEFPIDELEQVLRHRQEIVEAVKAVGYAYVTVDLEGFRSGNLNAALDK